MSDVAFHHTIFVQFISIEHCCVSSLVSRQRAVCWEFVRCDQCWLGANEASNVPFLGPFLY
ncbi:hypothetical protein EON65_41165 [archaeon]|nr:MAG: hypothetical protein EON65_41165 [archaeon]